MIAKTSSSLTITDTKPGSEMLTGQQWNQVGKALQLTRREQQVCQQLFDGKTRNEIAESLEIKTRTVRHYMENIHEKLCVINRVGVVLRIIQMRDELEKERFSPLRGDLGSIN